MAIDALTQCLRAVDLFQGLKPLQVTEIARRSDRIVYKPGQIIVRRDTQGDAAVMIVAGDAVRVAGPMLSGPAEPVPPGSLIGEMAMLIEFEHTSTIVARSQVRALRISREALLGLLSEDPAMADHFVRRIAGRLDTVAGELRRIDRRLAPAADQITGSPTERHLLTAARSQDQTVFH